MATFNITGSSMGVPNQGGNGADIFNLTATAGPAQIHTYGRGGNDTFNLSFGPIGTYSSGHHVRGGEHVVTDLIASSSGSDTFNFINTNNVSSIAVGRIEDFDASRDTIRVEGTTLNFSSLPSNVRVVEFNGNHNDPGADPQQWLLIKTNASSSNPGYIFYALEGARVDMNGNGGSNNGAQEKHFLSPGTVTESTLASLFNNSVDFIDQKNYVPAGFSPLGGSIIHDNHDKNAAEVNATIVGTSSGDLIAAGINDDSVNAGSGADRVWGGSGHDTLSGKGGNDTIEGGTGDDVLNGNSGRDSLIGGHGKDDIRGGIGNDYIAGNTGNDIIAAGSGKDTVYGGANHDTINGAADNDYIDGGIGNDVIDGGGGNDTLIGGNGNDTLSGGGANDIFVFANGFGADRITDFFLGSSEKINLSAVTAITSWNDLSGNHLSTSGGNAVITAGGHTITLEGVNQNSLAADDFIF